MKRLTWVTATTDASLLGIGSQSGRFCVVDLRSGASRFFEAGSWVTRALWTPDATRLLIGTVEGKLHVVSRTADAVVSTLDTGHGRLLGLAVHPDGTRFATCGDDGRAVTRSTSTLEVGIEIAPPKNARAALSTAFVRDEVLLVGYSSGFFEAYERTGQKSIAGGEVLLNGVASMAATSAGDAAILGGAAGSMLTLLIGAGGNITAGRVRNGTPPKPVAVNAIDIGKDGRFVAAFSDATAEVFDDVDDGCGSTLGSAFYSRSPQPEWTDDFIVSGACFVGDSGVIATSHFDGLVRLWPADEYASRERGTLQFIDDRVVMTFDGASADNARDIAALWLRLVAASQE